jgi:radical SAM superfamily enzyme YgiQ (UPF0313 family)
MRIAFLIPPFFRLMGSHNNKIGPSTLATAQVLKDLGNEVYIFNADSIPESEQYADWYSIAKNYWAYKRHLEYLKKGQISEVPGLLPVIDMIASFGPDTIILCCGDPAIPTVDIGGIEIAYYMIPVLASMMPDIPIVGYGYAFDNNPILASFVHKVLPPYGEFTAPGFFGFKSSDVLSLDRLPHFKPGLEYPNVRDITSFDYVMASRGCSWKKCIFCPHSSGLYRCLETSPAWFTSEVENRYKLGIKYQYFSDMDFLGHSYQWLSIISRNIGSRLLKKLSFSIEARADRIHPTRLDLLKEIGLTTVKIGVEGASDLLLSLYQKGIKFAQIQNAVQLLKEKKLKTVVYLLLGHPSATPDDYWIALDNARKLQADYYVINLACPYKGTQLYERVKDKLLADGLIQDGIEHGFTHLSDDLRQFWGISEDLFEQYLQLSASTIKEDQNKQNRQYVRNIL